MAAMSVSHTSQRQRPRAGFLLTAAVSLPWTWMRRARQRRELMGLLSKSDHLIKDVGLQRDAITREGLKPFWTV